MQIDKMVEEGYVKEVNKQLLIIGNSVEDLMQKMSAYTPPKVSHIINKVVR
jgi:predicted Rossmann-fold nucleotide-binding protein